MGRSADMLAALCTEGARAALAMPCVILKGLDAASTLAAAESIVASATSSSSPAPFAGATKEPDDVALPRAEWGPGRSVVVDRRFARHSGALLVVVPASRRPNGTAAPSKDAGDAAAAADDDADDVDASGCADDEDDDEDADEIAVLLRPASSPPVAGVLEVCKAVAAQRIVGTHTHTEGLRRIVVVHMACRMSRAAQTALAHVIEGSHERALFVLTFSGGVHARLGSLGIVVFVPAAAVGSGNNSASLRDAAAKLIGRRRTDPADDAIVVAGVARLAAAVAMVARIRSLDGDWTAASAAAARIVQAVLVRGRGGTAAAAARRKAAGEKKVAPL